MLYTMKKISVLFLLSLLTSLTINSQELYKDSGYVDVPEGGKLYYEAYGKGTPMILIHGHTLDRRMWRQQIPRFAKRFRVITPDMRGYGRSSRQHEDQTATHVDDLIALMDALGLSKAHVVGLSMGGFIASDMLAMYPERMITCVLASGNLRSVKGPSEPVDEAERAESDAKIREVLEMGIDKWKRDWIDKLIKGGGSKAEGIRSELTAIINDWDAWQLVNHEPRLYYAREALPVLQEKMPEVPTLFLSGEMEHKKPASLMKYIPNSEFEVILDCGHMSNMEQPDKFNKAVITFIERNE